MSVIEDPSQAVCIYCGEVGADALVGSGPAPGVAAHFGCWWEATEES